MSELEKMVAVIEARIEAIPVSNPSRVKAGYIQLPCGRIVTRADRKELKRLNKELEKEYEETESRLWSKLGDEIFYATRRLVSVEGYNGGSRSDKFELIAHSMFGCTVKVNCFDPFSPIIMEFSFGGIYGELRRSGWSIKSNGMPYFREGKRCELRIGEYVLARGISEDDGRPSEWDYTLLLNILSRIWRSIEN